MKKIIIALMMLCTFGAYAENENAATSKEYVDSELATKQPTVPAEGANIVMTFDSTADNGIGTKEIYDESASYASQTDALVTAGTANAAVQMAIQGEFECVLYDPDNPTDCWWWNIKSSQRLPAGYTELEYLESTGTQYINTGVLSTTNEFGVDIKYMTTRTYDGDHTQGVIGAQTRDYTNGMTINFRNHTFVFGNNLINYTISLNTAHTVNVILSDSRLNINVDSTNIYNAGFSGSIISNAPIFMFGYGFGNVLSTASHYYGRVYYCKIYQNGTLVRNFIPAHQDSTGVLGMYDTVTDTFFTNAGTGDFIAGPVASYLPQNQ